MKKVKLMGYKMPDDDNDDEDSDVPPEIQPDPR